MYAEEKVGGRGKEEETGEDTRCVEEGLIHCIPRIYTGKLFTLAFSHALFCIYIYVCIVAANSLRELARSATRLSNIDHAK